MDFILNLTFSEILSDFRFSKLRVTLEHNGVGIKRFFTSVDLHFPIAKLFNLLLLLEIAGLLRLQYKIVKISQSVFQLMPF